MTARHSHRYTRFYLTMLCLSTIGTGIGILNLFSIPATFNLLAESRWYAAFSFILIATWLVSVVALILLWRKRELGIQLKLSSYAVTILATIGLAFNAEPVLDFFSEDVRRTAIEQGSEVSPEAVASIIESGYYLGLGVSIMLALLFASLWRKAWHHQRADDERRHKNTPS